MSCLYGRPARLKPETLLSRADKTARLRGLFGPEFHRRGELFLPGQDFYTPGPVNDFQLELMADKLLGWLGIKQSALRVGFGDTEPPGQLIYDKARYVITIPAAAAVDSVKVGGLLAHQIMHYYMLARLKFLIADDEENEVFTDMACIEAGFGLLLLNDEESSDLIEDFKRYLNVHAIPPAYAAAHLTPKAAVGLGLDAAAGSSPFMKARTAAARLSFRKKLVVGFTALLVLSTGAFIYAQAPRSLTAEQLERRDTIDVLRQQYRACTGQAASLQNDIGRDDIFAQRAVDAVKGRCRSIMNRHNYEVDEYNRTLGD
jgi:hypothetical protein